jgi:hypothetical protein
VSNVDVSGYTDLTVYDAQPSDLVAAAISYATLQAKFPSWNPLEGNTEVALLEQIAVVVAELVVAINRLPGATVATVLRLMNIIPGSGTPSTATMTMTFIDGAGYTVPNGSTFSLTLPSGVALFNTVGNAVAAPATSPAVSTVTIPITCTVNASAPNGVVGGTALTSVQTSYSLNTSVLATTTAGGTDPESNSSWLSRGAAVLQSLSATIVTSDQFTTSAVQYLPQGSPYGSRAMTTDNWNSATSSSAPGYVTVSVMGSGGVTIPSGTKTALQADLSANAVAGLSISVVDATINTVNITYSAVADSGYTTSQVEANVVSALQGDPNQGGAGLIPDLWSSGTNPWNSIIRYNSIISVIAQAQGVAYVSALTVAGATTDVTMSGIAPLALLGTVTPTITGGS